MGWKLFRPGCSCCCCYETLFVICIYDETTLYSPRETYETDLAAWNALIDGLRRSTIRLGLIQPGYTESDIKYPDSPWPRDSDNDPINYVNVGMKTPRVTEAEIVAFFETLRTSPAILEPELLLFVLDNSGSITVSEYREELESAKATLRASYPKLRILGDVNSFADERWLLHARRGAEERTCG